MPCGVHDLYDFLRGSWSLQRSIVAAAADVGRFCGTARFRPDDAMPGSLLYWESGTLRLGGFTGPATRQLLYRVDGPRATVVFADGRPFHELDLRTGTAEVEHPCRADRYTGRFEVVGPDRWTHTWSVTGPRKDHQIRTVLDRLP